MSEGRQSDDSRLPEAPYRGIEPFRYIDRKIFFSRQEEIEILMRKIVIYRGVLLYAPSGFGKSSLINAGLIPAALDDDFLPERVRVQPQLDNEIVIERSPARLGATPEYIHSAFAPDSRSEDRIVLSANSFMEKICSWKRKERLLLIFDQFEEFVTVFEEMPQAYRVGLQSNIQSLLLNLLRDHSLPVKILFSFREDYLAALTRLFEDIPDLLDRYVRLSPLREENLESVILGPFRDETQRSHFSNPSYEELGRNICGEFAKRTAVRGVDRVNLSEVQIVCLKLWQSKDPQFLFENNGVEGILKTHLSESLGKIDPPLQDASIALLTRMVTDSGHRNIISKEDLLSRVKAEEDIDLIKLKGAVWQLEKRARLVLGESRNELLYYGIVSEFLVPWIRSMKIQRNLQLGRTKARKEEAAKRKRQFIVFELVTVLLAASLVFLIAFSRQREISEARLRESAAVADQLESEKSEVERELERAGHVLATARQNLEAGKLDQRAKDSLIGDLYNNIDAKEDQIRIKNEELRRVRRQLDDEIRRTSELGARIERLRNRSAADPLYDDEFAGDVQYTDDTPYNGGVGGLQEGGRQSSRDDCVPRRDCCEVCETGTRACGNFCLDLTIHCIESLGCACDPTDVCP